MSKGDLRNLELLVDMAKDDIDDVLIMAGLQCKNTML
jgi:hypothetical protein